VTRPIHHTKIKTVLLLMSTLW